MKLLPGSGVYMTRPQAGSVALACYTSILQEQFRHAGSGANLPRKTYKAVLNAEVRVKVSLKNGRVYLPFRNPCG